VASSTKTKYLVLGANGFVGGYLTEQFATLPNVEVRAFDRYSSAPRFTLSDSITVIKGDIFNDQELKRAIKEADYVIHSFSATTPFISDNDPYVDVRDNLLRSIQVFETCVAENIKKVGFISSGGAVYGTLAEKKVVDEEDAPAPVSPYGINKLAIEHYMKYFKRKYGMEYVVYRLSNPYGPRQVTKQSQGAIPLFLEKIMNGQEITIYGDGTMSRDYIYMEDAARMIVKSFEQGRQTLYNIGCGEQTSLNEILDELRDLFRKNIRVKYVEAPKTFLQRTDISIERYSEEFGEPSLTPMGTGLAALIQKWRSENQ